jgi:hypothetical protein
VHFEIIDEEQRCCFQKTPFLFACAVKVPFCELIEQRVSLTIEHALALLNHDLSDPDNVMKQAMVALMGSS